MIFTDRKKTLLLQLLVLLIVVLVLHNRWVVPRISVDQMRQLVALENIVQGHGITYQFVGENTTDILKNNSFPMGYYFVMLPAYLVIKDAILTHRIFEIIGMILLIWQLFLFVKFIEEEYQLKNFKWLALLFSLVQLNPWRAMAFTDIWSLMFFIAALRLSLSISNKKISLLLLIGFLSYCTISMRYAYYGLAFIPVFIVIYKNRRLNIKTLSPTLVLIGLIGLTMVFNHFYFSGMDHLEEAFKPKRWFLSHIKQMDPTAINAYFSDMVIFGALGEIRWGENTNWFLKYIFLFMSLCMMAFLGILSYNHFFRAIKLHSYNSVIILAIWIAIIGNIAFITFLSIYYSSQYDDYLYTWQLITRYYAPAYIMLQLLLILITMMISQKKTQVVLKSLIFLSFGFQLAYFISFNSRFSLNKPWENYVKFYDRSEMPMVMENYKKLLSNPELEMNIPEEQLSYQYLSIYYLTGPERLMKYLQQNEKEDYFILDRGSK